MDYRILFIFILLHCSINALPYEDETPKSGGFIDNSEEDDGNILQDEQQEQKPLELEKKTVVDEPKPAEYAVTELIIDIPDDRVKGPIVTNYSIYRPLNIASSSTLEENEKDKNTDDSKNDLDKDKKTEEIDEKEGAGKKNYISILHVKAEFENNNDKTNKNKIEPSDVDFGNVPHISGIKEYLNGIKQGIVNGFNSIIHKHKNNDDNQVANTGPLSFFHKIHEKTSGFAQKIHNHIFGDQEEDNF